MQKTLDKPLDRKDIKSYTYKDCINYSENKNIIISAYQARFYGIFRYVSRFADRGIPLDPTKLLLEITRIEEKYPIIVR